MQRSDSIGYEGTMSSRTLMRAGALLCHAVPLKLTSQLTAGAARTPLTDGGMVMQQITAGLSSHTRIEMTLDFGAGLPFRSSCSSLAWSGCGSLYGYST